MLAVTTLLFIASFCLASADDEYSYLYSARRGLDNEINFKRNYTIPDGQCSALFATDNYADHCKRPTAVEVSVVDSHDGEVWVSSKLHISIVKRHTFLRSGSVGFCVGSATLIVGLACPIEEAELF